MEVPFLILVQLLILSLTVFFQTSWHMQIHSPLSGELAAGQSSKGCCEWGCTWLGTSSVPWGPVLGPVLFNIFTNDMDAGVECTLGKFASDAELGGAVYPLKACKALQRELNKWSSMVVYLTAPLLRLADF